MRRLMCRLKFILLLLHTILTICFFSGIRAFLVELYDENG